MTTETDFYRLSHALAGTFQNREQALADPTWYVHLRLWCCPTTLFAENSVTFFIEQASAAFSQAPYRQRILRICQHNDNLTAEYYALKAPQAWQGAAQEPHRLQELRLDDLQALVNGRLTVAVFPEQDTVRFEGRQRPGERCEFVVDGETKFVELAFDVITQRPDDCTQAAFWMYDKGIEPNTQKTTWGAVHGPFKLVKTHDFSPMLGRPTN